MIAPGYCHMMARYNAWQNRNLYDAADSLTEAERRADRGAFFGSIMGTLSHIYWGDSMWMARFDNWPKPDVAQADSAGMFSDWQTLKSERVKADLRISDWAGRVTDEELSGDLTWYSGILEAEVSKPMGQLVAHFFNHQTHHRGQVHAMLTAAGAKPGPTDLGFMPEDA